MTMILIVISTLCIITQRLIQRLEDIKIIGRVETIQTTELLRSLRTQRRVLEI